MSSDLLGRLPSVKDLLESQPLKFVAEHLTQNAVVDGIRSFFDHLRSQVQAAANDLEVPGPDDLARQIAQWILAEDYSRLRPLINASGVLLAGQLGRSPLAKEAIDEIRHTAEGYCSFDFDVASGQSAAPASAVAPLLTQLTGAEGALVVNSHAGAALLALASLAAGREVVVSRGELVEIGSDYRLPQIFEMSRAMPREVGSANASRIGDFAASLQSPPAAMLRIDPSSYAAVGTERPPLSDLVALARQSGIPLIDDIGFGSVIDVSPFGLTGFPSAAASIRAGADLVILSGDALLGGPQCGVIVGRKALIEKLTQHPLIGPLRASKLTLAALAATLRLARDPDDAKRQIPLLTLLTTSLENLRNRAERLAPQIAAAPGIASAEAVAGDAWLESKVAPGHRLATWLIAVTPKEGTADELAKRLRGGQIRVIARTDDRLWLDLRTVFPRQDVDLVSAFEQLSQ